MWPDHRERVVCTFAAAIVALVDFGFGSPALAHEEKTAGPYAFEIGWSEEPAYSGIVNEVEVMITDANGAPVADLGAGALQAEITFGTKTSVLALRPSAEPGRYTARIVPTQVGSYTFHIVGTVQSQPVDLTSTCSDQTFQCVSDIAAVQFPSVAPSDSQLEERLARELARADQAKNDAAAAKRLAALGIGVGGLAILGTMIMWWRRGRAAPA
jgi:hypothetical protein